MFVKILLFVYFLAILSFQVKGIPAKEVSTDGERTEDIPEKDQLQHRHMCGTQGEGILDKSHIIFQSQYILISVQNFKEIFKVLPPIAVKSRLKISSKFQTDSKYTDS